MNAYTTLQGVLQKADDNGVIRNEFKTVGHILNFKVIDLYLRKAKRLEAVEQFRNHLKFFSMFDSFSEIRFRHAYWMAQQ